MRCRRSTARALQNELGQAQRPMSLITAKLSGAWLAYGRKHQDCHICHWHHVLSTDESGITLGSCGWSDSLETPQRVQYHLWKAKGENGDDAHLDILWHKPIVRHNVGCNHKSRDCQCRALSLFLTIWKETSTSVAWKADFGGLWQRSSWSPLHKDRGSDPVVGLWPSYDILHKTVNTAGRHLMFLPQPVFMWYWISSTTRVTSVGGAQSLSHLIVPPGIGHWKYTMSSKHHPERMMWENKWFVGTTCRITVFVEGILPITLFLPLPCLICTTVGKIHSESGVAFYPDRLLL